MCIRISRTYELTKEKVERYAQLSGDFNTIHFDQKEAERSGFQAPIAHGMLTMGLIADISSTLIEKGMRIAAYEMQFLKPVLINSTIHVTAEVKKENSKTDLIIIGKSGNEVVVKGEIWCQAP